MKAVQLKINMLTWFLTSGEAYGLLIMTLGLLLFLWAVFNLLAARTRTVVFVQVFLSFLPILVSLFVVCGAAQEFLKMATSDTAIKPSEFARTVSLGLVCGILGPLATLVPGVLGLIKLWLLGSYDQENRPLAG